MPDLSERKACRILRVPRAQRRRGGAKQMRPLDELLVARIKELIHQYPTFGYRRIWAMLRFRQGVRVNAKAVYRVLKQKRWFVHQRIWTPRPRVQGRVSIAERSNERWATDMTHVPCGRDGWAHLAVVIDLPRPRSHWLRVCASRTGQGGRAQSHRRSLHQPLRHAEAGRANASATERQRAGLPKPALSPSLPRLPTAARIYNAVHAGAERPRGALFPELEGGMRVAAQLQLFRRGSLPTDAVD